MIGSLVARVRELSLRVADLEGQLEAARRRIAVYEDFDAQVSDSLAAALRAAQQIRQRAQVSADAIVAEARAARPAIVQELDAMRAERDALRRTIESAPRSAAAPQASAPAATFPMAEMRSAATEALRGVFKELVAEIRVTAPVVPAPQVQTAVQTGEAVPPRPANVPAEPVAPSIAYAPPAAPQVQTAVQTGEAVPPRPANVPAEPVAPPMAYAPPARPPAAPTPPPPSNITVSQPVAQPVAQPQTQSRPALIEEDEIAPRAVTPTPVPAPAPAREDEWVPSNEAVGEIQVVLSPISSFPRLVELERRLQGMPVVRTVYARDFRNGVATLAIGLRQPMTVQEFATAVTTLDYPRLRIVSTTGFVLELRIDTEASSIA
jgi:cell division septum initiation protein DivIVA